MKWIVCRVASPMANGCRFSMRAALWFIAGVGIIPLLAANFIVRGVKYCPRILTLVEHE